MIAKSVPFRWLATGLLLVLAYAAAFAQESRPAATPQPQPTDLYTGIVAAEPGQTPPAQAPVVTLQDALERAKANSPQFQAAATNALLAREDTPCC